MELTTLRVGEQEAEEIISEIYDCSGYDFSNYSLPSLIRRIQRYVDIKKISSLEIMFNLMNRDSALLNEFIEEITVNLTEMFRDPGFFNAIRENVLPELKNNHPIKIWHAGCSTGEEVYSMAIVLKEQGLLDDCIIYATDINQSVLDTARKGIYSLDNIKQFEQNYLESAATGDFRDYYEIKNGEAVFHSFLKEKIIFCSHNLVSDSVFNHFDMVICRNVLIYFNKVLQNEVLQTFYKSLNSKGFLALGSKESLLFTSIYNSMDEFFPKLRIWRKKE